MSSIASNGPEERTLRLAIDARLSGNLENNYRNNVSNLKIFSSSRLSSGWPLIRSSGALRVDSNYDSRDLTVWSAHNRDRQHKKASQRLVTKLKQIINKSINFQGTQSRAAESDRVVRAISQRRGSILDFQLQVRQARLCKKWPSFSRE